ncbi:MAG: D-alanyl-D-alanine carboxypeptidase/D-alanyl-D-alanine-endopeptidase, partial [Edaphobacter sp.]
KQHRTKTLKTEVALLLAGPAVARAHWGIAVTAMDGTPIYSLNEGQLFQPASNAKLFTTSAAMAMLGAGATFETRIVAKGVRNGAERLTGDLVLVGGGDANLSGRPIPYVSPAMRPKPAPPAPAALRYLEEMADQVAKTGLKVVNGDVVGDDTLYPWEPYAEDWAIDDAVWGYGAPVSALTINDNQIKVTVTPGEAAGRPATVTIDPAVPYYTVDVSGLSTGVAKSGSHVQMERGIGSKVLRVYGAIAVDAQPDEEQVAIEDPAEYAAIALKEMLEARGIVVTGKARAMHRLSSDSRDFVQVSREPVPSMGGSKTYAIGSGAIGCVNDCAAMAAAYRSPLAKHVSIPLREDVMVTNKVSQNLHAELFLHNLGAAVLMDGSTAGGARVVRAFLEKAGIDKDDFVFFDGSGLSGHDLVAPRATVRLLQYAAQQPWFADWKRSLPVGGEDGTLASRFAKAPLKDHIFAKTGTLGEARALSGYLDCASGRTVIFSIMVGNHAPRTHDDAVAMDRIVEAIAAAN